VHSLNRFQAQGEVIGRMNLWLLAASAGCLLVPQLADARPCTGSAGLAVCLVDELQPAGQAAATDEATTDEQGRPIRLIPRVLISDGDVARAGATADPLTGEPEVDIG
jgi:hypothetical protein